VRGRALRPKIDVAGVHFSVFHSEVLVRDKPKLVSVVTKDEIGLGGLGGTVQTEYSVRLVSRKAAGKGTRARRVGPFRLVHSNPKILLEINAHDLPV
jgi:hypothetical protein